MVLCKQVLLLSQDYGKHLLGVEDLLQKHALVEADIAIQAERVRGVNASAQKFATDGEGRINTATLISSQLNIWPLKGRCLWPDVCQILAEAVDKCPIHSNFPLCRL